jgi:hypothetical protein
METVQEGGQAVSVEQKILFLSESPNCHQSRELRLIALEVRKREDRIKQLEDRIDRASKAFFADCPDEDALSKMLAILDEERNKP